MAGAVTVAALVCLSTRTFGEAAGFSVIPRRNVFGLKSVQAQELSRPVRPELPQIQLQGIANLLGFPQALLSVQSATKSPATNISCVLAEREGRDGVKVLRIDLESGKVWLTNQGAEQVLDLKP